MAFTVDQAARLTGVSGNQLMSWDRSDFFKPTFAEENRRAAHSRLYSFRDLACLKVLNALRNESSVPLKNLRETKESLARLGDDMWAKTTLYVLNRRVIFLNEDDILEDAVSKQLIFQIPLKVVTGGLEKQISSMQERDGSTYGKIEKGRRNFVQNRPTIAGTRIPVASVQAFIDAGYSDAQIIAEYPSLTQADVEAARNYKKVA
jgi:DNA-binding transcriptional MerR regulator